jgi:hypothetical protein
MRLFKKKRAENEVPEAQHVDLPAWANQMLIRFQRFENFIFRRRSLPWGLSVISVVEKQS